MPTIQIVPLPGAPDFDPKTGITATRDTFAMIFEYSEEDDLGQKNMPSDTEQAVHSEWAIASGARAVMHTTESFTVYYPHQYTADPATAGPCPSACEDPTRDSDHPALAPELVPCGLTSEHAGRHTATVEDGIILVWGEMEVWPHPPTVVPVP